MKKGIYKIFDLSRLTQIMLVVVCAAGLLSCKKIIEQAPENRPYDQVFWQTEKDALQALSGDYALLRKALTVNNDFAGLAMSHFAYGDLPTGFFTTFDEYAYNFLTSGGKGEQIACFIGDYVESLQNWTPHYKTITLANTILNKVPEMPASKFADDASKNKILGEALFLRAFSYFYMVRIWGDVPLLTAYDPQPGGSSNVARTDELIVLDTCINDLQKAATLLDWNADETSVRAGKGAVHALLAHVYMWKDFLTNGADHTNLQKAISAIDEITNKGNYGLVIPDYPRLFKGKSEEGIFEINMAFEQKEQQTETGFYYHTLTDPYIKRKTGKYGKFDVGEIDNLFTDDDTRKSAYFDFSSSNDPLLIKYCGANNQNIVYEDVANFSNAAVNSNIIIFRLADIMLLRAEANAKAGNYAAARIDLDAIRAKAGLEASTVTDDELYTAVIEERMRELFCEGHTWYDLVRSRLLTTKVDRFSQTRFDQEGWKWPVGRALFLNNNVLTQTDYWKGKVR